MNRLTTQLIIAAVSLLMISGSAYSLPKMMLKNTTSNLHQAEYVKDIGVLTALAENQNDYAKFALGVMHEFGLAGIPTNIETAEYWYRKAADDGYARAQHKLGDWYAKGVPGQRDYEQAVKWWAKAAEQNHPQSQYKLAYAYQTGKGRLLKDYKQAIYWYEKSAIHGDPDAQVKLGLAYYLGKVVDRDEKKAADWYKRSAAQNNYNAQYFLGLALCEGRGVSQDLGQCASWIRKAHENGDPNASKVWEKYELWEY